MDAPRRQASDLTDHLTAVRRRWWLVLALTALGVLVAVGVTARLPRTYEATTAVLVLPTGTQDANAVGGRTRSDINLDTEAQLVTSTAVATRAGRLLHSHAGPATLAGGVAVAVPPNSTVLRISYGAGDPAAARAGSVAFATAYLANRSDAAAASTSRVARQLDSRVTTITRQLRTITGQIAKLPADSSQRAFLESQRRSLSNQLDNLTNLRTDAASGSTDGGRIISAAALPAKPVSPSVPVDLGTGGLVGLLAGLAAALAWARFGRRVRYADDLPRYAGVPVLAEPPAGPRAGGEARDRTYDRLRNELAAAPRPAGTPADRAMIVVAGTAGGPATLEVAASLAAAFARSGADTILVDATYHAAGAGHAALADLAIEPDDPDGPAGTGADGADRPAAGWTDVLSGTPLKLALRPAGAEPDLRVLLAGTGEGPVPAQAAQVVLSALRSLARWVVLAAPDTASGADAQTLAALADTAVLAVELRAARRSIVADAGAQLRRVGAPVLGAVVVPRHRPGTTGPAVRQDEETLAAPTDPATETDPADTADAAATDLADTADPAAATDTAVQTDPETPDTASDPAGTTGPGDHMPADNEPADITDPADLDDSTDPDDDTADPDDTTDPDDAHVDPDDTIEPVGSGDPADDADPAEADATGEVAIGEDAAAPAGAGRA